MISFLLGSGFSYEEGIPGVRQINDKFKYLRADQIFRGTDQSAFFLIDGQKDPNGWFPDNVRDRTFVEEFIQFYIKKIIKNPDNFNYEDFFDFYYLPYQKNNYSVELNDFLEEFRRKSNLDSLINDNTNLLYRFHNIFSQLLAQILNPKKYYENVSLMNYPKYDSIIQFIRYCIEMGDVKVHSLNHDLLFEYLGSHHADLWEYYCDGFTDLGSKYYGDVKIIHENVNTSYKARIKFFDSVFDKKLSFIKLHGSVDTYIFNLDSSNPDYRRVKRNYLVSDLFKEVSNSQTKKLEYLQGFQYNYPDFLSGTTTKTFQYNVDYYKNLFDLFKNNLQSSDNLFVIGYGFKDAGINLMLEDCYLRQGKKMIVIDPTPNKSAYSSNYNIFYVEKGLSQLSIQDWQSLC